MDMKTHGLILLAACVIAPPLAPLFLIVAAVSYFVLKSKVDEQMDAAMHQKYGKLWRDGEIKCDTVDEIKELYVSDADFRNKLWANDAWRALIFHEGPHSNPEDEELRRFMLEHQGGHRIVPVRPSSPPESPARRGPAPGHETDTRLDLERTVGGRNAGTGATNDEHGWHDDEEEPRWMASEDDDEWEEDEEDEDPDAQDNADGEDDDGWDEDDW